MLPEQSPPNPCVRDMMNELDDAVYREIDRLTNTPDPPESDAIKCLVDDSVRAFLNDLDDMIIRSYYRMIE